MKIVKKIIFTLLIVISNFLFSQKNEVTEIKIFHTNDIHARIKNFAKLSYLVKNARIHTENVYLINAGDIFSGNPAVDQYSDKGFPIIDLMNKVGYNLTAIGNHEFDYGQTILNKRIEQANFEFICANINADSSDFKQVNPYKIFTTTNNKTIAFLSLLDINDNGMPESHPKKLQKIKFFNEFETSKQYSYLSQNNDITILLSHMGFEKDSAFAMQNTDYDLIIGGHSHDLIDTLKNINGTKIAQAGGMLKFIGEITILLNNDSIISITDTLYNFNDIEEYDTLIFADIEKYNNNKDLQKVIGNAETDISGLDNLGAFYTDAIVNELNVDLCFQNNGGIRIQTLSKGEITLRDIYQMDPFGNEIIKITLTIEEIKNLIKYSYELENCIELQVSGLQYTVYVNSKNEVTEIILTDSLNNPLENKTYLAAINSYIISSYNFEHKDVGESLYITSAETIINYVKKQGTIKFENNKRAFAITKD